MRHQRREKVQGLSRIEPGRACRVPLTDRTSNHMWRVVAATRTEEQVTQIFSDYVRSLAPSGEPSDSALDEVWTELRRVLRQVIWRRGLWDCPPSYLGVIGHPTWTTPETSSRHGLPVLAGDALDELVQDFYVELFVKRLANLRRYLRSGDSIRALVYLAARQLLQSRQQRMDRLGYRVYRWLRTALDRLVEKRQLFVLAGGPKIHNGSVLGFEPRFAARPDGEHLLAAEARWWSDDLILEWVKAKRPDGELIITRLESLVLGLPGAGVEVFGFKPLIDALKHEARERRSALWVERDSARAMTAGPRDRGIEDHPLRALVARERMRELSVEVEESVCSLPAQRRTREKLVRLWRYLQALAHDGLGGSSGSKLPSNRELARMLGIRHDRLPALFSLLRAEVKRCVRS